MTDPRNIAHDKKVQQEKQKRHEPIAPVAEETVQPGRKPALHHDEPRRDEEIGDEGDDQADAGDRSVDDSTADRAPKGGSGSGG